MIYKNRSKGVYSVEFAIVASLFFILFFAVIEFARLMYTWNVLTEVARRGARLATVCHVLREDDLNTIKTQVNPNILSAATFNDAAIIPNLTSDNLHISYLEYDGSATTNFNAIRLVRAEIKDYQHELLIPFFSVTLNSPGFSSTLQRESLGVTRQGYTDCSKILP